MIMYSKKVFITVPSSRSHTCSVFSFLLIKSCVIIFVKYIKLKYISGTSPPVRQNTFRVIHPYQNSTGAGGIPSPLFPSSPVVPERRPSFTPTENESIPSYITPVEEQDPFQDDYIEVLEDPPRDGPGVETQSVDSGSATEGDYVNWDKKNQENQDLSEDDSADNYINVPPRNSDQNSTGAGGIPSPLFPSSPVVPERRPSFMPTENASTDSDYDNDEGDYVNQPVGLHLRDITYPHSPAGHPQPCPASLSFQVFDIQHSI
ncbi:uncharacterized protein LOC130370694 isoform X2 [Gadus chalcogrammus]|uniref:uncharacterized protein LOC130370694 isoform X2 n=1 Tax=Gadus chalcogrammus TaxID=1042646 RepID=UPI0024C2A1B2|nr:uncharacterized protein LOC130370694 isoform X2 [Gadus chalcogrammus]